jgi:hypothetical protein
MRELIVKDDGQLRRLEHSIAAIECRSGGDQMRVQSLLHALYAEREELKRYCRPRARRVAL